MRSACRFVRIEEDDLHRRQHPRAALPEEADGELPPGDVLLHQRVHRDRRELRIRRVIGDVHQAGALDRNHLDPADERSDGGAFLAGLVARGRLLRRCRRGRRRHLRPYPRTQLRPGGAKPRKETALRARRYGMVDQVELAHDTSPQTTAAEDLILRVEIRLRVLPISAVVGRQVRHRGRSFVLDEDRGLREVSRDGGVGVDKADRQNDGEHRRDQTNMAEHRHEPVEDMDFLDRLRQRRLRRARSPTSCSCVSARACLGCTRDSDPAEPLLTGSDPLNFARLRLAARALRALARPPPPWRRGGPRA